MVLSERTHPKFGQDEHNKFQLQDTNETPNHFSYLNTINETNNLRFLGLEVNKTLSWKSQIDKLLPKLSSACFVIRSMLPYCDTTSIKTIYFAYFHSLLEYGIAFWGNPRKTKKCLNSKWGQSD